MTEILYVDLQMSNDVQLLCTISIHPKRNQILFSFRPDFPIITKIGTVKKKKHYKKDGAQHRTSSEKQKWYCAKFNDSWCNTFKLGFALCIVCRSDFSVTHGAENDINRHKDTSNHRDM